MSEPLDGAAVTREHLTVAVTESRECRFPGPTKRAHCCDVRDWQERYERKISTKRSDDGQKEVLQAVPRQG